MNLNDLAAEVDKQSKISCWNILIWGDPRTGKTRLAATIARVPLVKRIWWFDLENGWATLLQMIKTGVLSKEEGDKFRVIRVQDSPDSPLAFETIGKALGVRREQFFCETHGREIENCVKNKGCTKESLTTRFCLTEITDSEEDVIVIDTASQLGDSVTNYVMSGKALGTRIELDQYGTIRKTMSSLMQHIQSGKQNVIVCSHVLPVEMVGSSTTDIFNPMKDGKAETQQRLYPLMGSQPFSVSCGKYFQNIIYTEIRLGAHRAGSDSLFRPNVLTGSRNGWRIEDEKSADLSLLFEKIRIDKQKGKEKKG